MWHNPRVFVWHHCSRPQASQFVTTPVTNGWVALAATTHTAPVTQCMVKLQNSFAETSFAARTIIIIGEGVLGGHWPVLP